MSYPKIPSVTNESSEWHWGPTYFETSYTNKTVLDLGASTGDAAEYFLHMGAKCVISIEGNPEYFKKLEENSKLFDGKLIPIFMFIENSEQLENIIKKYLPNFVKSDIEGAESYLIDMKDEIWNLIPEYIIEFHDGYPGIVPSVENMYKKYEKTNYQILQDIISPLFNRVIHAVGRK